MAEDFHTGKSTEDVVVSWDGPEKRVAGRENHLQEREKLVDEFAVADAHP